MPKSQNKVEISIQDYLSKFSFGQIFLINDCLPPEKDKYLVSDKEMLKSMTKGSTFAEILGDDALKFSNNNHTYNVLAVDPAFTTAIDYLAGFNDSQIFKVKDTMNCIDYCLKYICKKKSIKDMAEYAYDAKYSRNRKKLTLSLGDHEFFIEPAISI